MHITCICMLYCEQLQITVPMLNTDTTCLLTHVYVAYMFCAVTLSIVSQLVLYYSFFAHD